MVLAQCPGLCTTALACSECTRIKAFENYVDSWKANSSSCSKCARELTCSDCTGVLTCIKCTRALTFENCFDRWKATSSSPTSQTTS